jgi:hypothetical protein
VKTGRFRRPFLLDDDAFRRNDICTFVLGARTQRYGLLLHSIYSILNLFRPESIDMLDLELLKTKPFKEDNL